MNEHEKQQVALDSILKRLDNVEGLISNHLLTITKNNQDTIGRIYETMLQLLDRHNRLENALQRRNIID